MAQTGRGQFDLLKGKRDPSSFHFCSFALGWQILTSSLCPYPKIVQNPFCSRWFRGREGPPGINGSVTWLSKYSNSLPSEGSKHNFWVGFFTWLVPIYLSQNPHLILSLVMFPYVAWTGELCFNEYKFAACSRNSCCFFRGQLRSSVSWGTCSTLIQTELISSPTLCSGKGKWS